MDVVHLASVDSTSTHAAALLAGGKAAPFAVWADYQTAGRGRRGAAWASPVGNVYLTIVLPRAALPLARQGTLPLIAGAVVAAAIERLAGVRLTLKWPNDLLFAGRKIGGLLLEGSFNGDVAGDVSVGIGVNLQSAPELPGVREAAALADIVGYDLPPAAVVRGIVEAFARHWEQAVSGDAAALYAAYAIGDGHVWRTDDGVHARAETIDASGALPLATLPPTGAVGKKQLLTSIDHGWHWLYQGAPTLPAPLAVADVGNTAIKLAWYAAPKTTATPEAVVIPHAGVAPAAVAIALHAALSRMAARAPFAAWPLHILSVNPPAAALLAEAAGAAGMTPLALAKRPVRRHGDAYNLAQLGSDRLAAIEAYLATLHASERGDATAGGLVVAAGTATTVDAVAHDGRHLGGLIFPGLATALASLHHAAHLLPEIDLAAAPAATTALAPDRLGRDTRSAMTQAVLVMTAGAIAEVQRGVTAAAGSLASATRVVVTGGWGQVLTEALQQCLAPGTTIAYAPDLVLSGARVLALGGFLDNRENPAKKPLPSRSPPW